MTKTITSTAYLQIKADRFWYGNKEVHGARILKLTQNKPNQIPKDTVAVKVRISIPAEAFENIPVVGLNLRTEDLTQVAGEVAPA